MSLNDLKERVEENKDLSRNFLREERKKYQEYQEYHSALVEEYLNDVGPVSKEINENLKKLEEHVIKKR